MRIAVIGAGVMGLTVATTLADAGHDVRVLASATGMDTTSSVAAAIWYPYRAYPQDKVTAWSAATFRSLTRLARLAGTGVRMRTGRELSREPRADPWWRDAVPDLQRLADLPDGYRDGFRLTVPVIDMPVHLEWLAARLAARGVLIEPVTLGALDDAPDADLVVNCAGLGSRTLAADDKMTPVRGQVVVVEQFGLQEWTLDDTDDEIGRPTYIVPRERTVVLGGTADVGAEDLAVNEQTAAEIVERCARLVPQVAVARVVAHRVGLRPGRSSVRLERAVTPGGREVVHCYGHGGAGVTLAAGCATEVAALAIGR